MAISFSNGNQLINDSIIGSLNLNNGAGNGAYSSIMVLTGAAANAFGGAQNTNNSLSSSFAAASASVIAALNEVMNRATSANPGGGNFNIQFNDDEAFAGDAGLNIVDFDTVADTKVQVLFSGGLSIENPVDAGKFATIKDGEISASALMWSPVHIVAPGGGLIMSSSAEPGSDSAIDMGTASKRYRQIFTDVIGDSAAVLNVSSSNLQALGTLGVTGIATATGGLTASAPVDINSTLFVSGQASLEGAATVGTTLGVTGITTATGGLTASAPVDINSTLFVSGQASLEGAATVGTTLGVTGITTATGGLSASAPVDIDAVLDVSGISTLAGLTASAPVDINSTLFVSGQASLEGAATVGTTLGVTGITTATGGLTASAPVDINSTLFVSGQASLEGAATVGTTLGVTGITTATGGLTASAPVDINSTLFVSGQASLEGAATVGTTLGVTGITTATGGLTASAPVDVNSTLSVSGLATFEGALTASSTVGIAGVQTNAENLFLSKSSFDGTDAKWPKLHLQGEDAAGAKQDFAIYVSGGLLQVEVA